MKPAVPVRLIPFVAGVGALLPGCGLLDDPILGDWVVTQFKGKVLPKTYTDDGSTYTVTVGLEFESDGDVELLWTKTWSGEETGTKAYVDVGSWLRDGRTYLIEFEFESLSCTLARPELECDRDGARYLEAVRAEG